MPRTLHARLDRSIRTRLHTLYEARDTLGVRRDAESLHALRIAIRRSDAVATLALLDD